MEKLKLSDRELAFEEWCRFAVRRMCYWKPEDDKKGVRFRAGIEQACSDMCVYFRKRKDYESPPYLERQAIEMAMGKCGIKWANNRQRLDFYEQFESHIKSVIDSVIDRNLRQAEKE